MEQKLFLERKGFHLVANQLHQHLATPLLAEACLYALLGHPVVLHDALSLDVSEAGMIRNDPFTNHFIIFLLSLLENSTHDVELCVDLIDRMVCTQYGNQNIY